MPDRPYVDRLEDELADLGRALDLPPPPPTLAADVRARLEAERAAGRRRSAARRTVRAPFASSRAPWLAAAAAVLVLALVAGLTLPGGDDGAVRVGSPPPGPPAAPLGEALQLGVPATLDDARAVLAEDLLVPTELGPPDEVLIRRTADPPVVFLVWAADDRFPDVSGTGIGVLVTEVEGRTGCTFKKMTDEEPGAVETFADGWRALWVEGRHTLRYCTVTQDYREQPGRLDAGALIWSEGSTTYRIEAAVEQDEAEALADSMG